MARRSDEFLLTLFPHLNDHEELHINGFVLIKSRHGSELRVLIYTEESRRRMNPGMFPEDKVV